MSDVVGRFHRTLVEEIHAQRPDYLTGPFTVAEIYQNLVPYRTHRDRIGVEMNGDYEDALLRLLAGEGGYLILDSEPALRELKEELEAVSPNGGLYREFAAVDVRLNPEKVGGAVAEPDGPTDGSTDGAAIGSTIGWFPELDGQTGADAVSVAALAPASPGERSTPSDEGTSAGAPTSRVEGEAPTPDDTSACRWCRAELPRRDTLNFCPFCGTDVHVVPCAACGEELEPQWRFCVACGEEVEVE